MPPQLFSGDTLFPGGPGATRWDYSSFPQIMDSLDRRLFVLPDETLVFPGHGEGTTIGTERPHIEEWRQPRLVTMNRSVRSTDWPRRLRLPVFRLPSTSAPSACPHRGYPPPPRNQEAPWSWRS